MFSSIAFTVLVLGVVVFAILVRQATDYTPESPFRIWTTRATVVILTPWFANGLLGEMAMAHGRSSILLSRSFLRGVIAIVLIWGVFRDEL